MAGTIEVEGIEGLKDLLEGMAEHYEAEQDYKQVLIDFVPKMQAAHKVYFDTATSPDGGSWPPISETTIKRKGHSKILIDTERLMRSLTSQSGDSIAVIVSEGGNQGLSFGTSVPYSHFHQSGTKHLPKRKHVGIDKKTLDSLADAIADRTVQIIVEAL